MARGKARGKAWGNALGGYRKQKRAKNGQFGSGSGTKKARTRKPVAMKRSAAAKSAAKGAARSVKNSPKKYVASRRTMKQEVKGHKAAYQAERVANKRISNPGQRYAKNQAAAYTTNQKIASSRRAHGKRVRNQRIAAAVAVAGVVAVYGSRNQTFYHNTNDAAATSILAGQKLKSDTHLSPRGFAERGGANTVWMHDSMRSRDMADVYGGNVLAVDVRRFRTWGRDRSNFHRMPGGSQFDVKRWRTANPKHVRNIRQVGKWDVPDRPVGQRPQDISILNRVVPGQANFLGIPINQPDLGVAPGQRFDRQRYGARNFRAVNNPTPQRRRRRS